MQTLTFKNQGQRRTLHNDKEIHQEDTEFLNVNAQDIQHT